MQRKTPYTYQTHGHIHNLVQQGLALHNQGALQEAAAVYRRVLATQAQHVDALYLLGLVSNEQGHTDRAMRLLEQCTDLDPDFALAHYHLGSMYLRAGEREKAQACFHHCLKIGHVSPELFVKLGTILDQTNKPLAAIQKLQQALRLDPTHFNALRNLGVLYTSAGKLDKALQTLGKLATAFPSESEPFARIADVYSKYGLTSQSIAYYRKAIDLAPDQDLLFAHQGVAYLQQGKYKEAEKSLHQALEINPANASAHSALIMTWHYQGRKEPRQLASALQDWNAQHARHIQQYSHPPGQGKRGSRPIRLGFVADGFHRHPVGFFVGPLFAHLDARCFQAICYSNTGWEDGFSREVASSVHQWRVIGKLSDAEAADLIAADNLDICFDLTGHAQGSRLLALARKPAPVQIKWVGGQFNSTGMEAMDYFLSDPIQTPQHFDQFYAEIILRMPHGYVHYRPPDYAPPVSKLPALENRRVTFGSLNNLSKMNPATIRLWANILTSRPESRLILKCRSLNDPQIRESYVQAFMQHGVEREQILMQGHSPHAQLLQLYQHIDIGLDPLPYSGGLTTCEALWMGVPVITLPGQTFASRHSASHLHNIGLDAFITSSVQEYLNAALTWSQNLDQLASLRLSIRDRMAKAPLTNGQMFARDFEKLMYDVLYTHQGKEQ